MNNLRTMLFWFILIMIGTSAMIYIQVTSSYHRQKDNQEQEM
jgi:hypothetical protein